MKNLINIINEADNVEYQELKRPVDDYLLKHHDNKEGCISLSYEVVELGRDKVPVYHTVFTFNSEDGVKTEALYIDMSFQEMEL